MWIPNPAIYRFLKCSSCTFIVSIIYTEQIPKHLNWPTLSSQMKKRERIMVFPQIMFNEVIVGWFSAQQLFVKCLLCAGYHTGHGEYRNEQMSPPWNSPSSRRQIELTECGEGCSAWGWERQRRTEHLLRKEREVSPGCHFTLGLIPEPSTTLPTAFSRVCKSSHVTSIFKCPNSSPLTARKTTAPFQPLPCPLTAPPLYGLTAHVQILALRLVSCLQLSFLKLG